MKTQSRLRFGPAPAVFLLLVVLALSGRVGAQESADATPLSASGVLAMAFANRYEVDLTSRIELVAQNKSGQELRRHFEAASKLIDDRMHSIGRLVWPEYLRGMTILTIEASDRSHDAFVYLPSLRKVRRVGTAVRGDSLFGTDVTYEDLERRRIQEYRLNGLGSAVVRGEPVYLIPARPLREFNYERVVFVVARSDWVILETRYFKRGEEAPFRVITAPRSAMVEHDGHVIPTRLTVRNHARGTKTEVTFKDLQINPPIDDHLFSLAALERKSKLPIRVMDEEAGEAPQQR
jgi:hypothetical protein